ncbi:MAG: type II secretion system F family protein [Candidatus Aureabacteria bacterium]|nr:type II secretion system F family protein [Candidatus Auribacterota bacterium]
MKFSYVGKDRTGKNVSGTIDGSDRLSAAAKLRARGIQVANLTRGGEIKTSRGIRKVKPMMLMMMTRQLSTLLRAGVPIVTAIHSIVTQIEDEDLQSVMQNVESGVKNGLSLSKSLAGQRGVFSELYVNIVFAGESGGVLPEVLARLADLIERDEKIRTEVKAALRYPFMVIGALIFAFLFLVNFVVPKFAMMFRQFKIELPLPTRILIALSDLMENYWMWMLGGAAVLGFAFYRYKKTPGGKRRIDNFSLKLPAIGPLIVKFNMARFASLLSTLIKSGVPIVTCLNIVRNTVENEIIKEDVDLIIKRVESGEGIYVTMLESSVFPNLMANMVEIGEKSGAIDEMLVMISDHYEMETHYAVKGMTALIEPVMTVTAGTMVLGLALAIFLPMWDIVKAARQ